MNLSDSWTKRQLKLVRLYLNHIGDSAARLWVRKHLKRLMKFQGIHQGDSCFIIGNGPSLNQTNLSLLRKCKTFGMNKIYLHPDFKNLEIDYHVAVNSLVIEQSIAEFKSFSCTSFLSHRTCANHDKNHRNLHYLLTCGDHYFSKNPYRMIGEGSTVTFVALQLAYFMGFETVFLVGVDHDFSAQGSPHETQRLEGPDLNHFHPDYFSGQNWQLPDLEGSELAYHLARYHFALDKRKILDATVGGKLDIFPKIDFESAVASCTQV